MTNRFIQVLSVITGIFILAMGILDYFFYQTTQTPFFNSTNKIWSHQGVATQYFSKNSIYAISNALKNHDGVELDLWLIEGSFKIGHDKLDKKLMEDFRNLESVSKQNPNKLFWLDIKNLDMNNIEEAINLINSEDWVKRTCIIESKNAFALAKLNREGYFTSLWLRSAQQNNGLLGKLKFALFWTLEKFMISIYRYNAISMSASQYMQFQKFYPKSLNIHLWLEPGNTSYEKELLMNDSKIKIILED